ncbi:hypothetical protein E2C01_037690 [Portunus trituberculatus]|uniref:Uncharacterized protein n=1 Tax=Portunus trituberculatus TaxID=210409 RepID=A0A5B7FC45_PORTR|nr:hypothetical protein [Portunus trituberculatus]
MRQWVSPPSPPSLPLSRRSPVSARAGGRAAHACLALLVARLGLVGRGPAWPGLFWPRLGGLNLFPNLRATLHLSAHLSEEGRRAVLTRYTYTLVPSRGTGLFVLLSSSSSSSSS